MRMPTLTICLGLALADPALAQTPTRTTLAVIPIAPGKSVTRVEATRVEFRPGQVMPAHMHPVPVVCFVAQGSFLVAIGDAPERPAPLGSVTYEPPGVVVHYFKNASASAPAQLNCAVLAGEGDSQTSVMLPAKP